MKLISPTKKLQNGGNFLPLFADYNIIERPKMSQESTNTKKSSSSEDKGKLTEKDLFTLLKDVDGLPNEMEALVQNIQRMYQFESMFKNGEFDVSGLANLYAKNIYALKRANFNKKQWEEAKANVEKQQGLNEYAVTNTGQLFVKDDKGSFTQVDVKTFLNNKDKYTPVTNNNLLWHRAHDPNFINESQIVFDVVNNGIGISEIHKMIKDRMTNLGSTEYSQQGYIAKQGNKILQGLQVIEDAKDSINKGMTLDGIYKSEVINKTQKEQAQAALQYIYSTLPENAKAILALHSGNAENPNKGALDVITQLISSTLYEGQSIKFTFEGDLTLDGKTSKSKGGPEEIKETVASMFLKGYGQQETFSINPGTNLSTIVISNTLPLVDKLGDRLGVMCSLQEVSKGQFGSILDWNNATMGGRQIKKSELTKVLSSDGQIYSIDFPVDINGNPDLRPTTIQAKNKADEMIKSAGIDINDVKSKSKNADKINSILEQCGLSSAYDSQGNIVGNRWSRFAVMNGVADSKALGMNDLDDPGMLLQEINDDEQDTILQHLKAKSLDPKEKYNFDDSNFIFFHGDDYLYKGTIWIPVKDNHWNALIGSDIKQGQGLKLEELQQNTNRINQLLSQYNHPNE